MIKNKLVNKASTHILHLYLNSSLRIIGNILDKASKENYALKEQIEDFRDGARILFKINYLKNGYIVLQVWNNSFHLINEDEKSITDYDLAIIVKHPILAFKILTLQESNTVAVANNRFLTSGDASLAIRFINCLEIVEANLLPSFIAKNIVAKHEHIPISGKINFIKNLII